MRPHRTIIRLSAVLAAVALAKGCGDGGSSTAPPTPEPARPTTVTVSPSTAELTALGETVQLRAEVRDQNASVIAGVPITWRSSAADVATVDAAGLVTAAGNGEATITASAGSASGFALVTVATVDNPDRAVLIALYEATDGPNWVNSENWLTDAPLGDWYGVDTDAFGRVIRLNLSGGLDSEMQRPVLHGLSGSIPSEIGNLTSLLILDLRYNLLSGPIPPELGNLARLELLDLGRNLLSGPIPPGLDNLAHLERLQLDVNKLSGPIPPELGNLARLEILDLSFNLLSGPIPPEFGNLASLWRLALYHNDLTGSLPPELGDLASLTQLWLHDNSLSGPIPPELGDLVGLRSLTLHSNALSGPIPESFLQLDRLEAFDTEGNEDLCVPGTFAFVAWVQKIENRDRASASFCNASDVAVLGSLYETAGGTGWMNSAGWQGDGAVEEWHGVTADFLGRVTGLDLARNGLAGQLPPNLGELTRLTELRIGGNALSGRLPLGLTRLPLQTLQYTETELCTLPYTTFQTWLSGIPSHEGTGVECAPLSDRDILVALYGATDGPNWTRSDNWLSDAPLGDWYGVDVNGDGRVFGLRLGGNALTGPIPPDLGRLARLQRLALGSNSLSSEIPPELGDLAHLTELWLNANDLTGPIPPELGHLTRLTRLVLWANRLSGHIPPELGELRNLSLLVVGDNELTGPIPAEFGNLASLTEMWLRYNNLSGPLPPELGNLAHLQIFGVDDNALTGPIPPEFGRLAALERLEIENNRLTGPVPPEIGGMSSLRRLSLTNNAGMSGPLPSELTGLGLEALIAGGTSLCAPRDPGFQVWLETVYHRRISGCGDPRQVMAYLTQAVQSPEFPVPLVAGEEALLRVFPTAGQATSQGIPAVRTRFYVNDRETHVEDIPGKSTAIPTEADESSLSKSANAEIPGHVVQPGLEMVIEVDPDGTLDPGLGVAKRVPATGRLAVEVREMPLFDLTLIPFIWTQTQDASIVELIGAMAADPEYHEMLWHTRTLLPVGDLEVTAHEPVMSSSNSAFVLRDQAKAIRAMEGGTGHYMAIMPQPVTGADGVAERPGRASFSLPHAGTIAHELGHNMSLGHAPCGTSGDPSFPYLDGSIGAWGYDFRDGGSLVHPYRPDLMSYCFEPQWISDYSFTNALRYRLFDEGPPPAVATRSLLLWGGVAADSVPFLEPAFVVDAPAALPDSAGEHRITGRTASGGELFSLSFAMPETADGDGSSSFAFVLPAHPEWAGSLASITLSGPEGSVTLDGESDSPMAILRNPSSGQVRGFLRDPPSATQATGDVAGQAAGPGLDMLFSRGIPNAAAWRR